MSLPLNNLLNKFPDHRQKIIELYNRDEDFRTLCEDFLTGTLALEQGRRNTIKDSELETEFLHVYVDLEKEVMRLLEK